MIYYYQFSKKSLNIPKR